jgi:hypothetical protein
VEVAPSLRTSGSLANRGRVRPIADPAALRAARQREQAESLMAHRAIRAALATDGAVRLSHFDRLPDTEFSELLDLLAVGLDAEIGADGARRALSLDGQVEVVLSDDGRGEVAALRTESGVLHGPDMVVTISLTGMSHAAAGDSAAANNRGAAARRLVAGA